MEGSKMDKMYKMKIDYQGREGELVVIAESEVGALCEGMKLLELIGINAQPHSIDLFE